MHISSSPPQLPCRPRKRRIYNVHEQPHLSSDPPTFSSDPPDVAIDNDRNHKRVYKGHWWSHRQNSAVKHEFERNFDSGVFMASDDSLPAFDAHIASLEDTSALPASSAVTKCPARESSAHLIVNRALEQGDQVVDLSNLSLEELSSDIPLALLSLVNPPRFHQGNRSPDEQEYHSLNSSIQLFLANNTLQSLPPSIWKLQNLTVLSLRNNNIANLPGGICKLTSLQELNVANNRLRWLPWELLQLLGPDKPLSKLHLRPNPLFSGLQLSQPLTKLEVPSTMEKYKSKMQQLSQQMSMAEKASTTESRVLAWWLHQLLQGLLQTIEFGASQALHHNGPACLWSDENVKLTHSCFPIATSNMFYFEKDGSTRGSRTSPVPSRMPEESIYLQGHPLTRNAAITSHESTVPSLLELSMKQCAASLEAERRNLAQLLHNEAPAGLLTAIEQTYLAMSEGPRICSSCSREYIIPRTEWVEYWHCIPSDASTISPDEMFWPFLRRGCSWACTS